MRFDVQMKLRSNPLYIKFIRENSHWYKILNRNPDKFNDMVEEMKVKYRLRATDRINNVLDSVDLVTKIFKVTNE